MPSPLSIRKLRDIEPEGPFGLLVESTAPINVEDGMIQAAATSLAAAEQGSNSENLTEACSKLAEQAALGNELSVVIQVHGFNNPAKVAYVRYGQAWDHYRANAGGNVLYVGYRWPGEGMGSTLKSSLSALPKAAFYLLGASVLMLLGGVALTVGNARGGESQSESHVIFWVLSLMTVLGAAGACARIFNSVRKAKGTSTPAAAADSSAGLSGPLMLLLVCLVSAIWLRFNYNQVPFRWDDLLHHFWKAVNSAPSGLATILPILIGGLLVSLPVVVVVFRILVYFRDAFRAEHFGVPDLVEFIRHLDLELDKQLSNYPLRRVSLSFIGHSMGALVTTGTVRILTDVFDQNSMSDLDSAVHEESPKPEIGRRLRLGNLVLVSPDIPAEALLSGRSNFLASSIRRFDEAHLFSNEGDVVLRCISAIANAFSFPSSSQKHGQRLGNAHVTWDKGAKIPPPFGIVNPMVEGRPVEVPTAEFLNLLYVGHFKVPDIQKSLKQEMYGDSLANCVTFFDCTDYRDVDENSEGGRKIIPALTYGRRNRFVSTLDMALLLVNYLRMGWLFPNWRKDVHSAYFDFPMVRTLIYSTAEGGARKAISTVSNTDGLAGQIRAFDEATRTCGLQVLFSGTALSALQDEPATAALPPEWEPRLRQLILASLKSLNTVDLSGLDFQSEAKRLRVLMEGNPEIQKGLFEMVTRRSSNSEMALALLSHLKEVSDMEVVVGPLHIVVANRLIRCVFDDTELNPTLSLN